jgi:signal transduction histidine kinase/ligand-binding sensor domain-containing protein
MWGTVGKMRGQACRLVALGITLACTLLVGRPRAFALDPSLDVSQYAHTAWKIREGFSNGYIRAFAQTPDGYLWLGTEFGLLRFDGVRTIPWQPGANQHFPSGTIHSLLATRDGTLWIGGKGLASWNSGKLTQYVELADQYIFALREDREGTLWVGGGGLPGGKLCAIHSGSVHCYGSDDRFGPGVFGLYEDIRGNLWAGVSNGLWRWRPGPPKFYPLADEPDGIQALGEDDSGKLLFGWRGGIYRLVDGKTEAYPLPGGLHVRAKSLLRDRDGGLWIESWNHGLVHVHQGRADLFTQSDGLSGDDLTRIFEDREGSIWVATLAGLDRFRDFAVSTFTVKQGLSSALVGPVLADKNGSVWLGSHAGLNRWDHGEIKIPYTGNAKEDGKLNGQNPTSLFQDDDGRIWTSTMREFGYLENGQFTAINGVPGGNILAIVQDTAGDIWADNERLGLFRLSPRREVQQITWAELGHKDHASVLAADRSEGGLWIGFFLGGIAYFADGKVQRSYAAADGLGGGRVSGFLFDHDGVLWASTEGGLSRLKNGRVATLTSKNGLPCDTVHWTMEDGDQSLWLYTACGLVRIAHSEIDTWTTAVDKDKNAKQWITVTIFDSSDGVRSVASPGHYAPQVARTSDGKIWFLPFDGVSVIDPRHLPFNKLPPPVHIEQVTADGKTYDPANGLQLPPHVRDLSIDYTALSLVAPEKIHFRYKLEGQDPVWREVVNDRQVQYSNLAPRHYTFRVIACNNDAVWNEAGAALEFSVLPAYYQTNWFRLLCVAFFLGLLWALYQLRLQQMQRQFAVGLEARVGERLRIARELHDTLLQSFQGVAFQLQAARKLILRKANNAEEVLDDAILATEEAIREGRSAIRDLRPEPAAQRNLSELLDAAGRELATAHELNGQAPSYRVLVEGKQQDLSPMLQDEVYRICREVIRNAFAHAAASHIEVEIRYDQDQLRLRVRDDGKGIDPKVLASGQSGHFGIPGMRERAQRIGAHLNFWSEMGAGAEVELTVPASMAYQKRRNGHRFRLFQRAGRDEQRS